MKTQDPQSSNKNGVRGLIGRAGANRSLFACSCHDCSFAVIKI